MNLGKLELEELDAITGDGLDIGTGRGTNLDIDISKI